MDEAWSIVEVSRVGGRSRLTSCLAVAPLKILSPKVEADYSTAVLSSYGGGLVAGDCARLRVRAAVGRPSSSWVRRLLPKCIRPTDGQVARQEVDRTCRSWCLRRIAARSGGALCRQRLCAGAGLASGRGRLAGLARRRHCRPGRARRADSTINSYTSNISIYLESELVLV